ncbi:TPA: hypothetical protein OOF39_000272 [Kluyvera ascorbata]|nr:hypothetical protein [Kluyvera ascorbata]
MKLNNSGINLFFHRSRGAYNLVQKGNKSEINSDSFIGKIKIVENTPVEPVFPGARKPSTFSNSFENVKPHKLFRGIRCWFAEFKTGKHAVNIDEDIIYNRVNRIINKLTEKNNNVALLSFDKSAHSAIVIHHSDGMFSMYNVSGEDNEVRYIKNGRYGLASNILNEMANWNDMLQDENVIFLPNLNVENIENHIKNFGDHKFNVLTHNCSKFAAKALLAGFDNDNNHKFAHDRKWQMPANTLELAKEIAFKSAQKKDKYTG